MAKTINLKYKPTPKQILAHTAPERFVLYGGAVGGGKSVWLAEEGLQLSLDYPGNVGYLCRHELSSFRRTTLITMLKFWPDELIRQHHQTENYFQLINGSMIYYGGLGDDVKAIDRLKSMDLGWFGIDQAEETTEEHFFLLASRLRLILPKILYKGLLTANPAPGWVKSRFIEQEVDDHVFIPAVPRDNPFLPVDYEARLRAMYPAALAQQLLDGDWNASEGTNYLFNYTNLRNAVEKEVSNEGDVVMAVDVARFGDDESCSITRQGDKVIWIESWSKCDLMETTGRIADLIKRLKPVETLVDVVGIGAGVVDRLKEQEFKVRGVNVGEAANNKEYFNLRSEMYWQLAERFQQGRISIPNNQKLISQLASIRYKFKSDRQKAIESKDDMRKEGIKSPDQADALAMAFIEIPKREHRILWV